MTTAFSDMAEAIVAVSRQMPADTPFFVNCTFGDEVVKLARVKVVGGIGFALTSTTTKLLYPANQLPAAVHAFMNTALHVKKRVHGTYSEHRGCTVMHGDVSLGSFRHSDCDHSVQIAWAIMEHMRHPPLNETEPIETHPFDARNVAGWAIDQPPQPPPLPIGGDTPVAYDAD